MDKDQYYTAPEIAKSFVDTVSYGFPLKDFDYIIEPAAGTGNIFRLLPAKTRIGYDIEPKYKGVIQADWLETGLYGTSWENRNTLVITNPPFGGSSAMAIRFFNKAARFAKVIAFIVPNTWVKYSIHRRLNKDFSLLFTEKLPANSFICDGEPYNVQCCMQIWARRDFYEPREGEDLRITEEPPQTHPDFKIHHRHMCMSNPDDIARLTKICPFALGQVSKRVQDSANVTKGSQYFIEPLAEGVRETFSRMTFDDMLDIGTGLASLARHDVVREYSKRKGPA